MYGKAILLWVYMAHDYRSIGLFEYKYLVRFIKGNEHLDIA